MHRMLLAERTVGVDVVRQLHDITFGSKVALILISYLSQTPVEMSSGRMSHIARIQLLTVSISSSFILPVGDSPRPFRTDMDECRHQESSAIPFGLLFLLYFMDGPNL
jgi:hypothetical protein